MNGGDALGAEQVQEIELCLRINGKTVERVVQDLEPLSEQQIHQIRNYLPDYLQEHFYPKMTERLLMKGFKSERKWLRY